MWRQRALKVVLVLLGLFFVGGPRHCIPQQHAVIRRWP